MANGRGGRRRGAAREPSAAASRPRTQGVICDWEDLLRWLSEPAQLALRLLAATLQAVAVDGSPLAADAGPDDDEPPSGEVAWRAAVRELASVVLEGVRLKALLAEPALAAAVWFCGGFACATCLLRVPAGRLPQADAPSVQPACRLAPEAAALWRLS